MDKLIDELAKGRPMEKILRKQGEPAMWVCPKCGRAFRRKEQDHYCGKAPETIEEYIRSQPEEVQSYLYQVNDAIQASIPDAKERKKRLMHELCKCPHWCKNSTRLHSLLFSLCQ